MQREMEEIWWGNVLGKDERTLDWSGTVLSHGSQRKAEGEKM